MEAILYIYVHFRNHLEVYEMKTITFTEFRRNATACLDAVERGEKIRILRHGRPVADVVPVSTEACPVSWKQPALMLSVDGASLSREILREREQAER